MLAYSKCMQVYASEKEKRTMCVKYKTSWLVEFILSVRSKQNISYLVILFAEEKAVNKSSAFLGI